MKTKKRLLSRTIITFIITGLISTAVATATDLQKTYTWKYVINKDASVLLDNYDCNLTIHTWDKGETEYRLTVDAKTRSAEDADILDKYLQNLKFVNSTASLTLRNTFWQNRNNIMGRMTMKLEGGKEVSLTEFTMKAELWIPAGCKFGLTSKYSEINMENFAGRLILNLYNDNFYGGSLAGNTEIIDKYSTIDLKDTKDLKADLYSSKIQADNTGNLDIESKYTKFTAMSSGSLNANSYSDKYSITKTGDIVFKSKYSDLKTETSGQITFDCYEGTFIMKEVKDIKLTSKYADFQFMNAGNITIGSTYSDKMVVGKVISLGIEESKYCTFRIDELKNSVTETDGYEDKFIILRTDPEFRELNINGKYIDISLGLPKSIDYRFKAKINYPKLEIDESQLITKVKIKDGSSLEYNATRGTEKEGMPVIEVNGYQMSLKIIGL
jgi:hypothetical protein